MLIQVRGIDLAGEFDVSKGKHIDVGWRKVREAMCRKLCAGAPWFVSGGEVFDNFCEKHGVDRDVFLEEMFKSKASEKWKHLQDVYKEKKRGTVTVVDHNGDVVQKRANCTGEQRLDDVDWPFYVEMQQAMQYRPSVCPPSGTVLQTQHPNVKGMASPTNTKVCSDLGDSPNDTLASTDENPLTFITCKEQSNKRSARIDEADSPKRACLPAGKQGRRPSSADRRPQELLSAMLDQSSQVKSQRICRHFEHLLLKCRSITTY